MQKKKKPQNQTQNKSHSGKKLPYKKRLFENFFSEFLFSTKKVLYSLENTGSDNVLTMTSPEENGDTFLDPSTDSWPRLIGKCWWSSRPPDHCLGATLSTRYWVLISVPEKLLEFEILKGLS